MFESTLQFDDIRVVSGLLPLLRAAQASRMQSRSVRVYVTTLPPALLSNYEICYYHKILEIMQNLNVLGLKEKSLVQMLQQFLPHHTKFSCHIWQIIDTSKSLVLL